MSLKCYRCYYDTEMPKDQQFCNATVETCGVKHTQCATATATKAGVQSLAKGCIKDVDCVKACDDEAKKRNFTSCFADCCTSDLCNSANNSSAKTTSSAITMVTLVAIFVGLKILY